MDLWGGRPDAQSGGARLALGARGHKSDARRWFVWLICLPGQGRAKAATGESGGASEGEGRGGQAACSA